MSSAPPAGRGKLPPPLIFSSAMTDRMARSLLENIDLMVCDMAGTTVQEGGLVYQILQKSMREGGLEVADEAFHHWHGAKKEAVIEHFARENGIPDAEVEGTVLRIADVFMNSIDEAYFSAESSIAHIDPSLMSYFTQLKRAGIKIGLDTGYPQHIQAGLVKRLNFDNGVVDSWISSYDVKEGRPYPYMIFHLMERLGIEDVRRVVKVGDSVRDIEEGLNAGCGLVVGVLSGADSQDALFAAGAHVVTNCVTDLPVPRGPRSSIKTRLPDLS